MTKPLVDTARLQLSGISAEEVDDISELGEVRPYTVLGRCVGHEEKELANEGTRRVAKIKIVRLLHGVDKSILDDAEAQPTLFDSAPGDPDSGGEPEGPEFDGGPAFSAVGR